MDLEVAVSCGRLQWCFLCQRKGTTVADQPDPPPAKAGKIRIISLAAKMIRHRREPTDDERSSEGGSGA
jgi:hypothetical protein